MEIVQLSDIHMGGSYFRQDFFDVVIDEVNNKLKPDVIIITGDITDEGLLFQFERARAEINRFDCSKIIVLAGNHDYRVCVCVLLESQVTCYSRSSFHFQNRPGI